MIIGIEGRPGTGKSYYGVKYVVESLKRGKTVYTNMRSISRHKVAWYLYRQTGRPRRITLDRLRFFDTWELSDYVRSGQLRNCRIVLDEVMVTWLSRDWSKMSRQTIEFFSQHRKYNVDFTYIAQSIDRVDTTLRDMTQNYITMRNTRFWRFGFLRLPQFFLAIHFAEDRKSILKRDYMFPDKRIYGLYDSWAFFPSGPVGDRQVVELRPGVAGEARRD